MAVYCVSFSRGRASGKLTSRAAQFAVADGAIPRAALAIVLLGISFIFSACSEGYYVDPAAFRGQRVTVPDHIADTGQRSAPAIRSSRRIATGEPVRSRISQTSGSSDVMRPWPRRGTPEFDRLQAEDAE